mgnify:CR=1 FL=1
MVAGNELVITKSFSFSVEKMSETNYSKLILNRVEIVEDLLVEDVLNFLRSTYVFDSEDAELIKSEKTSKRQAEKLLDLLSTKSNAAFYHFRTSLGEGYPHLVELLDEEVAAPRKVSTADNIQERGLLGFCHTIITQYSCRRGTNK